jgi:hypothetical protein
VGSASRPPAGHRLTGTLGRMATKRGRFLFAPVSVGADASRASRRPRGFTTSPLPTSGSPASVNAAVGRLFATFHSPPFARNVLLRRAGIGPAIMKGTAPSTGARGVRGVRGVGDKADHCVSQAGFGGARCQCEAMRPNPASERTCRESPAFLREPLWRHAAQPVRWASRTQHSVMPPRRTLVAHGVPCHHGR